MKLRRLVLERFHAEQPLELTFQNPSIPLDPGEPRLSFLVGPNGTGKSRVLEQLGLIFSHLAIGQLPGLDFLVEYTIGKTDVLVTTKADAAAEALAGRRPGPILGSPLWILTKPHGTAWSDEHVRTRWPAARRDWLPGRVYGYSTGPVSGLEWSLTQATATLADRDLADSDQPLPDGSTLTDWMRARESKGDLVEQWRQSYGDNPVTVSISAHDALLAALALLGHPGPATAARDAYLARRAGILRRVGLHTHTPLVAFSLDLASDWRQRLPARSREALAQLVSVGDRRIALPIDESTGMRAVFDVGSAFEEALLNLAMTPLVWFDNLHAWWRRGALRDCHLVMRSRRRAELLIDDDLSDGEFLILGRYGLLLLVADEQDALVLLDEPETHFNDRWKSDLVKDLAELVRVTPERAASAAELLIATHSDLTLTDADQACVTIFELVESPDGRDERLVVRRPLTSPFGADRSDIARDVFGLDKAIGTRAQERIDDAARFGNQRDVEHMIRSVGPGFHRYRLLRRLDQLEDQDADRPD